MIYAVLKQVHNIIHLPLLVCSASARVLMKSDAAVQKFVVWRYSSHTAEDSCGREETQAVL